MPPPYDWEDEDDFDPESRTNVRFSAGTVTSEKSSISPPISANPQAKPSGLPGQGDIPSPDRDPGGQNAVVCSCPVDHMGTEVYVKGWLAPGSERRPILVVHDIGESISLYRDTAKQLVAQGISVYGFDLRGHGRSGRMVGHIPKFETLVSDLLQVVAWVRHQEGNRLPILVGQGVGALILAYFQEMHPKLVVGCVFCSPCFQLAHGIAFAKRFFIKSMSEIAPTMRLPPGVTPRFTSVISQDRASIIESLTDTQSLAITANFANELLNAMSNLRERFFGFRAPSLFVYSLADNVCDYSILEDIQKAVFRGAKLHVIPLESGGHHLLTEGQESRSSVLNAMLPWLESLA